MTEEQEKELLETIRRIDNNLQTLIKVVPFFEDVSGSIFKIVQGLQTKPQA